MNHNTEAQRRRGTEVLFLGVLSISLALGFLRSEKKTGGPVIPSRPSVDHAAGFIGSR